MDVLVSVIPTFIRRLLFLLVSIMFQQRFETCFT